jgi:hypothetical protein
MRIWDGKAWEEHCLRLWKIRYATDFQEIPSARKRDFGIEAFTFEGHALQCFAPLEPLATNVRYGAQRDKLWTDLKKLRSNALDLQLMLGDVVFQRYVFLVPIFDGADLVKYAASKTQEVRGWNLPFISDAFRIVIHDESNYPREVAELVRLGELEAQLTIPAVSSTDLDDWVASNDPLINNLERKLRALPAMADPDRFMRGREQLLERYLAGQEMLDQLRDDHPELWQEIDARTTAREQTLPAESTFSIDAPGPRFEDVRERHRDELAQVPGLSLQSADQLAWAATAGWLLHCPLDFAEAA